MPKIGKKFLLVLNYCVVVFVLNIKMLKCRLARACEKDKIHGRSPLSAKKNLLYVIRKLATDFLQLLVLHEISKRLYHWKA